MDETWTMDRYWKRIEDGEGRFMNDHGRLTKWRNRSECFTQFKTPKLRDLVQNGGDFCRLLEHYEKIMQNDYHSILLPRAFEIFDPEP